MGMKNLKGEKRASECTRVIKDVLMIEKAGSYAWFAPPTLSKSQDKTCPPSLRGTAQGKSTTDHPAFVYSNNSPRDNMYISTEYRIQNKLPRDYQFGVITKTGDMHENKDEPPKSKVIISFESWILH
ncbi:hypothetical protein KQX54_004604 [Cotesia glomerata]|uniref:Uncharacterized protein n=1 Tax=Cotesia glomerata TaxID=32391 RepID=A0AAV7I198_COTGL|nr:hypothetical protein KQX54_004604 [Cotesia glomerata]